MVFTHILSQLIHWCDEQFMTYAEEYGNAGGLYYIGYQYASELRFKLATLVDREFESLDAFREEVVSLLDVHYEGALREPADPTVAAMTEILREKFLQYFLPMTTEHGGVSLVDHPYIRVVLGQEGEALIEKFRRVWGYEAGRYWEPLEKAERELPLETLFIMFHYAEPYMEKLSRLLGLPFTRIYRYGERDRAYPEHCLETEVLTEYGGLESIYTDKEFTWAVYFSHENTVTFAGAIVPLVKKLLEEEKDHWNKFEWL